MSDDVKTLLERMPWRGKFTADDVVVINRRLLRVEDAMTDAVGAFGQIMYTDPAHLKLLALHVAMAGDFFDDGQGRFIEYRIRDVESDDGQVVFQDAREWRKVGEFGDEPRPDDTDRAAEQALSQINTQLPPKVRRKLMERMAAEYTAATEEPNR